MANTLLRSLMVIGLGALLVSSCSNGASTQEITGGATGAGGISGGAGADSGGTSGSAGSGGSATTGGASGSGGTSASGGASSSGGSAGSGGAGVAGGSSGQGGASGTGGVRPSGGASARGGASDAGGARPSGGASGRGGATGTGGGQPAGGSVGAGGTNVGDAGTGGGTGDGGADGGSIGRGGSTGAGGDMPLVYDVENTGADCQVPTSFPAFSALKAVANLPDPFLMESGTRISSRSEWACRRAEISAQIQHWELGTKPAPPADSDVTATYSGGKLTVVVKVGSQSVTLTSTITTPSGTGPFPVMIKMDGAGVPVSGIATMSFTSSALAAQMPTRGTGTFWNLFPDKTAGAYAGWSWGVSRLIDGLFETADQNKIDVKRIGVTGCSYAGKMALYAGAFDERIALTIPEESGGGGEAAWRVSSTLKDAEDLDHAQGTGWYSANLNQFKNADAPKLPFDQHELAAMVAPRALLTIGNNGISYLASEAGYVSMKAATEVYKALGVPDRIGYSINGNNGHCAFPSSQAPDVQAFVDKFLLGKTANTAVAKSPTYSSDLKKWISWDTPTLK
ncbi:MAG: dockerin-like protein [Deltaproteobacteria bacterium]|nr:dockerin-like protein [Deltaproteobacteria bacterium]